MELTWPIKLRIAAAAATGTILIGLLGWPLASTPDPQAMISVPTLGKATMLIVMAAACGFVSYLVCWPYGNEIGTLAVPSGLAVWAFRSASVSSMLQQINPVPSERQEFFATLRWEPIYWVSVVLAGCLGVLLAHRTLGQNPSPAPDQAKGKHLNTALGLAVSLAVASLGIKLFARDVTLHDNTVGTLTGEPAIGQITFAVSFSFCAAAFVVKKLFNTHYVWPIIASGFVTALSTRSYLKPTTLTHLVKNIPSVFFPNAGAAISPVQVVAFASLGAIAGFWLAIRLGYWRQRA